MRLQLGIVLSLVASNAVAPASSASPPSQPLPLQLTPVLGSLIGIGSALILAALIIVLIMRLRDHDRRRRRTPATDYDKAAVPLHTDGDDSFDLREKKARITEEGTGCSCHWHSNSRFDCHSHSLSLSLSHSHSHSNGSLALAMADTRDEEERAFDKILSMSTSKRMLVSPSKSGTLMKVTFDPDFPYRFVE